MAGLRPMRSESGPKSIWPKPSPTNRGRDDELGVVRARHPEVAADRGQRRQHRVDRERDERHQEGDERNELAETKGRPVRRPAHAPLRPAITKRSLARESQTPTRRTARTYGNAGLQTGIAARRATRRSAPTVPVARTAAP